ncbi:baseplate J/gp47 family protein [Polycladidibacter stylochi]|uniref:baseplate J/gp47 family protein n=1 Tax=Polycladidibacter stylochi TaxID=1807766 RepID=UPI00082D86DC|nr:baseplate J/gp47 family protein [Pseudovibrio stylochi]
MNDLSLLPAPLLVGEPSVEDILARKLDVFLRHYKTETGKDFTALTESSPVVSLLRAAAEDEYNERLRQNARYRARFVYFADGDNLDLLLSEEGLQPVAGESRARKQERIRLQRAGSSAAGPAEWYRRHGIGVAPDEIADIKVDFPQLSHVRVTVLASNATGIPSSQLLQAVNARLQADDAHPDDHIAVSVVPAVGVPVFVHAAIVFERGADQSILKPLETAFHMTWAAKRALGRKHAWSWISSQFMGAGIVDVQNLGAPPPDILPNQVPLLSAVKLEPRVQGARLHGKGESA